MAYSVSYTQEDLRNGWIAASQRLTLLHINTIYSKYANIGSKLKYTVRQATLDDYYFSESYENRAIWVDVEIPENLCELISCFSQKYEGVCKPSDPAVYQRVGTSDKFLLACQPACFNIENKATYDDDGNPTTNMVHTYWKDNQCLMHTPVLNWMMYPGNRNDAKGRETYGFDAADNFIDSFQFNKAYCDAYEESFDNSVPTCESKWWEKLLGDVIGSSVLKMIKMGINELTYGTTVIPPSLGPEPTVDSKWDLETWRSDIDETFVVPDANMDVPTNFKYKMKQHDIDLVNIINRDKREIRKKTHWRRQLEIHNKVHSQGVNQIKNKLTKTADEYLEEIMVTILSLFKLESIEQLAAAEITNLTIDMIKSTLTKLASEMLPKIIAKITGSIFTEVMEKSLAEVLIRSTATILVKTIGQLCILLAEILAEFASIVGILLAIVQLLDLVITLWDPFHFSKRFNPEVLDLLERQGQQTLKSAFLNTKPVISFTVLVNLLLTEDELKINLLESYVYMYEYLNSLTFNAEGSRIDKGDEFNIDEINVDNKTATVDKNLAQLHIFTKSDIVKYEDSHYDRMEFFKIMNSTNFYVILISAFCVLPGDSVFASIFILISLIFVILAYANTVLPIGTVAKAFMTDINFNLFSGVATLIQ